VTLFAVLVAGCTGDSEHRPSAEGAGAVVFDGSFDSGTLAPWPGAQCANTGVPSSGDSVRGTITVQSDTVGEGQYAARIDLPAAGVAQACEALIGRPIGVGTNDYYALMLRFPADWREPTPSGWGVGIAQFNFENIWGTPVGLGAHADGVALGMQTGLCRSVYSGNPGCAYSSNLFGNLERTWAIPAPLEREIWHELIIHVRWTTDSSGVLEAWHRLKGEQAWRKTVTQTGYPTLQWTADYPPSEIAKGTTVDKIGAYRKSANFPLTIWLDGFTRATTFNAAAATLP
jgi:polysaccharide lyase-like protein